MWGRFTYCRTCRSALLAWRHKKKVEAVLSPTAGWLLDVMAFAEAPETLQHRATLEVKEKISPTFSGVSLASRSALNVHASRYAGIRRLVVVI